MESSNILFFQKQICFVFFFNQQQIRRYLGMSIKSVKVRILSKYPTVLELHLL